MLLGKCSSKTFNYVDIWYEVVLTLNLTVLDEKIFDFSENQNLFHILGESLYSNTFNQIIKSFLPMNIQ